MTGTRIPTALLLLAGLLTVSGCAGAASESASPAASGVVYQKITAEEAKGMMEDSEDYILLDVRTQAEFEEAHIPGAVLLPDYEIEERAAEVLPDQGALILVYCRSGSRSAGAAKALLELGYTDVYDFGGIIGWPYDTVTGSES